MFGVILHEEKKNQELQESHKAYYEAHKEEILEKQKAYRASRKEELREMQRARYHARKEKTYLSRTNRLRFAEPHLLKTKRQDITWQN